MSTSNSGLDNATHRVGHGDRVFPHFLENRLQACEAELFAPRKNKKPLVLGNCLPGPDAIMLQSNDYLNISNHQAILSAQLDVLKNAAQNPVMSAVFLHEDSDKHEFEKAMAEFTGFESSILCQSGWAANVGLMQVIADSSTPVYIDFFTHMSLWEGVKVSGATPYAFRHNDPSHLERLIKEHGQGIVLFDSLYSTTGDIAPLRELIDIADRYECISVVDESHSLGTHGRHGGGLVDEYGLTGKVDFITASLAKAFAGRAGIICCSSRFARYYPYMAYPAIFSSTLLPYEIAGLKATLDVIRSGDDRRRVLHEKSGYFRDGLTALGYNIASMSQIVSIEGGLESDTELLRDALEERNVFGSVFLAPATPKTRSLMRFSLHSGLEMEAIDYVLRVCEEIRDEIGMSNWKSTRRNRTAGT
ncbi:MAG: quorum-sensing autoinducer CAI-1 synthase [Chlorobium sp.]|uniref:alpha-hydroxyketone-type quorum-sensing autoinducer synthase n=1 Tax=Chlorobium sp. TaxID=1095 RepID=UPI0025C3D48E|nr:alpha-hydroxyketone-type quorum-sensing autoinducer synthase [Chlorobium sp.]MCF8383732.1 quorum-sensing autoinducer CAI-1 synthase [Chlorobium sp.]